MSTSFAWSSKKPHSELTVSHEPAGTPSVRPLSHASAYATHSHKATASPTGASAEDLAPQQQSRGWRSCCVDGSRQLGERKRLPLGSGSELTANF